MLRGVLFDSDNRDHDMTIYNAGRADVPRTVAGLGAAVPGPRFLQGKSPISWPSIKPPTETA
jgi:hypothetical protein